jgi:hypothetical protein
MNSPPAPDRVRIGGPLRPFADGYLAHLVEQGYALRTARLEPQFVARQPNLAQTSVRSGWGPVGLAAAWLGQLV